MCAVCVSDYLKVSQQGAAYGGGAESLCAPATAQLSPGHTVGETQTGGRKRKGEREKDEEREIAVSRVGHADFIH